MQKEVDGIQESSEDFTQLEEYDPINGGDLVFNTIVVRSSDKDVMEEDFPVKALISSKLFYLTQ